MCLGSWLRPRSASAVACGSRMVALGQEHGFWKVILDSTDPQRIESIPKGKERLKVDSWTKFWG